MSKIKIKKPKYELGQEVQVFAGGHVHRAVITQLEVWGYPSNDSIGYYCQLEATPPNNRLWLAECSIYPLNIDLTEAEVLNGEIEALCELNEVFDKLIQVEYAKISDLETRKRIAAEKRCALRKHLEKVEKALRKEHK